MMLISRMSVAAIIVLGAAALAAAPRGEEEPKERAAALDDLAWLSGYWTGTEGGVRAEECWLHAAGGMMLGVHRDAGEGRKTFFEYLRIEEAAEGIVYQAAPMGRAATPFALLEAAPGRVVFENKAHDFPQRIIYERDGEDSLRARIEGEVNGTARSSEWRWQRADFPGAAAADTPGEE